MKRLYLKISLALFSLLILLGLVYIYLTGFIAREYLQETKQIVYGNLADDIVGGVEPLMNEETPETLSQHICGN